MPPEFCEFNPEKQFLKCIPWLIAQGYQRLYPHLDLQQKLQQVKSKSKKPTATFYAWPEISLFHNVRHRLADKPQALLTYRAKIKLHGSNAAVNIQRGQIHAQSRNELLWGDKSHYGFRQFVDKRQEFFRAMVERHVTRVKGQDVIVFGEWCGKGIMQGAAICSLTKNIFAVFAVQIGEHVIVTPRDLAQFLFDNAEQSKDLAHDIYIVPWATEPMQIDFQHVTQLEHVVQVLTEHVIAIDKTDPWVREEFGIEGVGEGLVWYPVLNEVTMSVLSDTLFKTKGPSHAMVQHKRGEKEALILLSPEVAQDGEDYANMFVTEQRLQQAFEEVCKGRAVREKTNQFVQWMVKDIKKEGKAELEASKLTWDQVEPAIKKKTQLWYQQKLMLVNNNKN
jgi:hypothetical protein